MTAFDRVAAVLRAIDRLAKVPDPQALSDGLSAPMASWGLEIASGLIHRPVLEHLVNDGRVAPDTALVVVARGVFTAPLEWVAGLAVLGSRVFLKAPSAAPAFCEALAECFEAEGLCVEVSTGRDLPEADAVVAMGSDAAIEAIAARFPSTPSSLHGHRFSVALVGPTADASSIAEDVVLYDGRGCFTPTGVFVLGSLDAAEAVAVRLAEALDQAEDRWPRGDFEPEFGPVWRERMALGRATGRVFGGESWGVSVGPLSTFEPSALPRWISVHAVPDTGTMLETLAPWRAHLAACAIEQGSDHARSLELGGFERVCAIGHLQRPRFGRPHGGAPFLEGLLSPVAPS